MTEPTQHFFQSQGLRLAYCAWGDPSKPPLVLVHGGRDHARSWDSVAEAFERDYYVVAPDLRGHGDSQWVSGGEYLLRDHVLDLVALLDVLGERASVVGHSFGGYVVLLTAGAMPERFDALVLIEGTGPGPGAHPDEAMTPGGVRAWVERRHALEARAPRVYPTLEEARDRMVEANRRLTPELATHLARHGVREVEGGYAWKFDNLARAEARGGSVTPEQARAFWVEVTCPVLLLVGEESGGRRADADNARHFRDARAVTVPGAGHWVHHDRLDVVVHEIRRHLEAAMSESDAAG